MSDIFALTVARNEESRYLESFLENVGDWADFHFFYDDQSDDETAYIASQYANVVVRPDIYTAFAQDEGMFREAAWAAFEQEMEPREGDWIFVIDCDEMVVGTGQEDRLIQDVVKSVCDTAVYGALSLTFLEIFGWDTDGVTPLIRTDGFWGLGFAPRLFTYQVGARFAHGKVGVPAVPSYVMAAQRQWKTTNEISVMHFGYADVGDHLVKYQRYKGHLGHNPTHIESILSQDKVLVPWGGCLPGEMVYGDS